MNLQVNIVIIMIIVIIVILVIIITVMNKDISFPVVLCIPVLPLGFFVFATTLVCVVIVIIVVGFLGSIIYLRKVL